MVVDPSKTVITNIRRLYKDNKSARQIFETMASRRKDTSATSVDHLSNSLGISRGEAVSFARVLQDAGCGEFKVGRRGQKSRFVWAYSPISLGKAAAGEDDEIEDVEPSATEIEEDEIEAADTEPSSAPVDAGLLPRLTISDAKAALALSLGIPITAIEIIIRS